ncbi:MAG: TonB-dependent receptor [Pseudomonadales bacterium]|nr:TonB-dependent receptor [Pseudomonadales bacterium]
MIKPPFTLKASSSALAIAIGAIIFQPQVASAQQRQATPLQEITVTARKREESLQDVPISVQAVSGEFIDEQGIVDFQGMAAYTPSFSYTTAPGASDLYIMRGLGTSGSGAHFEPSVGQVFNGYFSTRSRLGRAALIDVAQVEVLKGPQGAIIGKNTSLGAINITSNKPTEVFESKFSAQYNFDASEGYEVEGMLSGPLVDGIRARAVVNYRDVDGWIENIPTGDDIQKQEDLTFRLMLDIDLTDSLTAELMYQRMDYERLGKARVVAGCFEFGGFSRAKAEAIGFNCDLDDSNSTLDIRRENPAGEPFNTREPWNLDSDMFGITLTWDLENAVVTSLSAHTQYEITDFFSGDQMSAITPIGGGFSSTAGERIGINNAEDYHQFYQELRISSTGGGMLDYTGGVMYFNGEMNFFQAFHSIPGAIGSPAGPAVSRNEFAGTNTESLAAFGQVDWHFTDQLTLSLGGRVTNEDRKGRKAQVAGEAYTSVLDFSLCNRPGVPLAACTMGDDGQTVGGFITGDIDKTNFSYNVSLQYALDNSNMFYVSHATGFKSGGFDLRGAGDPSKFIFAEEESLNVEVGGKHTLLDGTFRFNWTLYYTDVDDLQSSANDPFTIQQIVAPANVTSKGVELDFLWAATDNLSLNFVGAYTDAEYDNFIGSCYLGQAFTGTGCFNVDAMGNGVQDLKGQTTPYTPEFSFVAGGEYRVPMNNNMDLSISGKWIYMDKQYMSIEKDPFGLQGSTNRLDSTISLKGETASGSPWTVALVGRNLTDKKVFVFGNSTTLSSQAIFTTNLEETRSIALRLSMGW